MFFPTLNQIGKVANNPFANPDQSIFGSSNYLNQNLSNSNQIGMRSIPSSGRMYPLWDDFNASNNNVPYAANNYHLNLNKSPIEHLITTVENDLKYNPFKFNRITEIYVGMLITYQSYNSSSNQFFDRINKLLNEYFWNEIKSNASNYASSVDYSPMSNELNDSFRYQSANELSPSNSTGISELFRSTSILSLNSPVASNNYRRSTHQSKLTPLSSIHEQATVDDDSSFNYENHELITELDLYRKSFESQIVSNHQQKNMHAKQIDEKPIKIDDLFIRSSNGSPNRSIALNNSIHSNLNATNLTKSMSVDLNTQKVIDDENSKTEIENKDESIEQVLNQRQLNYCSAVKSSTRSKSNSTQSTKNFLRCPRPKENESDANLEWNGHLSKETESKTHIFYSRKVFLGGISYEVKKNHLNVALSGLGNVNYIFAKDIKPYDTKSSIRKDKRYLLAGFVPNGYCYCEFEDHTKVDQLLKRCAEVRAKNGEIKYYLSIKTNNKSTKTCEVKPWNTANSLWSASSTQRLIKDRSVFVGAIYGSMTAIQLKNIMNDLFGNCLLVSLDLDKNQYPIGSCRISFGTEESYKKAIQAEYVVIETNTFKKKLQIDPFLSADVHLCSMCERVRGPVFCRNKRCFKHFCERCFKIEHNSKSKKDHERIFIVFKD